MRAFSIFTVALVGLPAWSAGTIARGQFEAPANSLAFEDSGTLEMAESGLMRIRDSKNEIWLLSIVPETKVSIEGEAEIDCLRPGLFVQLEGELDKKGMLKEDVDEITIVSGGGRSSLGFFAATDEDPNARPVRNPVAGSYVIKGKVISYRPGEVFIAAGMRKVSARLSDEVTVKLNLDDVSLAQPNDTLKIKAWYFESGKPIAAVQRPGKALAEEITVTLAKPLAAVGKKIRSAPERHTRPVGKSSKTSR